MLRERRSTPARRAGLAAVGTLLALAAGGLAACSGSDGDEDAGKPPAGAGLPPEVVYLRSLPDSALMQQFVAASVGPEADTVDPEALLPRPGEIASYGSLTAAEQRCVLDYDDDAVDESCVFGDPSGKRDIVLWGDSRAAMWLPAVAQVADQTGHRLTVATKMGCPPLLDVTPWLTGEGRSFAECARFNSDVAAMVDEDPPDVVVLTGGVQGFAVTQDGRARPLGDSRPDNSWVPDRPADRLWQEGLGRTLATFDDRTEVFVLGEAPYLQEDPGVCLADHLDSATDCGVPRRTGVHAAHDAAERRTARSHGATYVSPLPWLCSERLCPAVVTSRVTHRDAHHLNREFVRWVARALGVAIGLDDWRALED